MKEICVALTIPAILLYFAFSFVLWSFNPYFWDMAGRFFYIIISSTITALPIVLIVENRTKRRNNDY
jgi:hypothetical protein